MAQPGKEVEPELRLDEKLNLYGEFKAGLQKALLENRSIRLRSYTVSDDVEIKTDAIVHLILQKYQRLDLKPLVYSIVKELLINGTRANLKRVFFVDRGYDIQNAEEYEKGTREYRATIREENAENYGIRAREMGYYVESTFRHMPDGIRVEVVNLTSVTPQEEERLRNRLEEAMKYETMIDFYMHNQDETEGAGLGLAMITIMLRAENIDPHYFRIFSEGNRTVARLEIPFSDRFDSVRDSFGDH